ncbi:multidrug resistance-associated protein 5 [Tanacetum coccineum]
MTIPGPDGIELDVWNDGIFMLEPLRYDSGVLLKILVARLKIPDSDLEKGLVKVVNDYDLIHMYDMYKMYGGIKLYLDHCDIDLSQYLANPDPNTEEIVSWAEKEAEEEALLKKNKEKSNDVGKGKMVVESDSENDEMIEDSDSDDSDYSNKSFDYLSAGEEELIQLRTRKANRSKIRLPPIDMAAFASTSRATASNKNEVLVEHDDFIADLLRKLKGDGEDYNLQDPFVDVKETEDKYPTHDQSTHWRMKTPNVKEGFKNGCRRVFALDGCFLKSPNHGEILTAIGRDGNNNIYPIAWVVVNVENKDNSNWFLELLGADLDMPIGQGLTLMSDQHKGLIEAVKQIKAANPGAYQFLIDKDPKTWSRAFFKLDKGCEAIENGFSECFNSVLVSVRNKPLLTMLEAIRVIVLETMNTMRKISATYTDDICPSILMRIDLMKNHTRFWHVIHTGGDSLEVRSGCQKSMFQTSLESIFTMPHTTTILVQLVELIFGLIKVNSLKYYLQSLGLCQEGQQKKRIRASHEGGSGTRVSKVGGHVTCQNCFQVGHNKKGCKAPPVQKPVMEKKKAGRPRKGDATDVGRTANLLGGSANPLGVSANPLGRSASGVGRNASGFRGFDIPGFGSDVGGSRSSMGRNATCLGRSASGVNGINVGGPVNVNMVYDNVFMGSTNVFVGSVSGVGGYAQGTGGNGIGRGVVRGSDIPRLKWSPPHKRAFNRVGGISFSTRPTGSQQNRPRQQKVKRGFARWFGDGDSGGVSYDMDADTQGNQTASQAIPSVQGSQTEVEIPTQEIPSQATNEVPPEVQRVPQHRPIAAR